MNEIDEINITFNKIVLLIIFLINNNGECVNTTGRNGLP